MLNDVTEVTDVTDVTEFAPCVGEQLLDDIETFIAQFVAFPSDSTRHAVTAWIVHTWTLDCFDTTPRLAILSPEPGSGKSRLLEILEILVKRPEPTTNASASYLYRCMQPDDNGQNSLRPTILLDEADTIFGIRASKDHEELRGFINGGYRRGAFFNRAAVRGKTVVLEKFPSFAAVAIAGLDDLPDTIMTRSVIIRMRRRSARETVKPYRRRTYYADGAALAKRIEAWTAQHVTELSNMLEHFPEGIEDRNADIWEPLLLIGDAAGEKWSHRLRNAALELVNELRNTGETLGIRLLADLRHIFQRSNETHMKTTEILQKLHEMEDSPWGDLRGKPLDARGLSQRLSKYGVKSTTLRNGSEVFKGYDAADLADPWSRYLPPAHQQISVTSVTSVTSETS